MKGTDTLKQDLEKYDNLLSEHDYTESEYNFSIERVSLIMTPGCNMECSHCMVDGGINSPHTMTNEDYRLFLREVDEHNPANISVTGGGEPMLPATYDMSMELLGMIDEETRADASMVSNIYWATDPEKAQQGVDNLVEAGADSLTPSWDLFHAEYYDSPVAEPLANVIEAGKKHEEFRIHPKISYISSNHHETMRELQKVAKNVDGEIIFNENGRISHLSVTGYEQARKNGGVPITLNHAYRDGNGKRQIDRSEFNMRPATDFMDEQCPISQDQEAVFTLMPDGTMLPCCNGPAMREPEAFALGNYSEQSIDDALHKASTDPIISAITGGNMHDALRAAAEQGLENDEIDEIMQQEYNMVCNFCDEIVNAVSDKEE